MYESIKIVPIPDTESDDIFNILTSNLPLTTADITPHTLKLLSDIVLSQALWNDQIKWNFSYIKSALMIKVKMSQCIFLQALIWNKLENMASWYSKHCGSVGLQAPSRSQRFVYINTLLMTCTTIFMSI